MQPKVSILIPVFNVEKYLRQCMDSVVGQTLQELEIVCINDGSTDSSLNILKEYAENDSRIVIVDKENGGYGMAMNIALSKATGEYIGIVEPDDFVPLNMFEELYDKAVKNELDFIKADFYGFSEDSNGEPVYKLKKLSKRAEDYNVVFNPSENPDTLRYKMSTWTGIYKRSFIQENNIRYNETPGASYQDNGFWFQTFYFGKRAMLVEDIYYRYRMDNPNSSVKNPAKVFAVNTEYDYIRGILLKYPEKWEKFKSMFWYIKYYNYLFTLHRISKEFKKDYIDRASAELKFGFKKGEFNKDTFNKADWVNVSLLINSPDAFYNMDRMGYTELLQKLRNKGVIKKFRN